MAQAIGIGRSLAHGLFQARPAQRLVRQEVTLVGVGESSAAPPRRDSAGPGLRLDSFAHAARQKAVHISSKWRRFAERDRPEAQRFFPRGKPAIISLRPKMRARNRVNQLHGHPQHRTRLAKFPSITYRARSSLPTLGHADWRSAATSCGQSHGGRRSSTGPS